MVVGHRGNQNVWGLTGDFLPDWVDRTEWEEPEVEAQAAQRAIRALGTASPAEIHYYFVRGRYQDLKGTLIRLREESTIHRVRVAGLGEKDVRYVHDADVPLLESMDTDAWQPRTSLLPPFDNLICGRDRTNRLFGFDYVHEQFVPKSRRKFGTYLLPILWGDRLIGRVDSQLDRTEQRLLVHSVHAERGAPTDRETSAEIGQAIAGLAEFLGAREVVYSTRVPRPWKASLR